MTKLKDDKDEQPIIVTKVAMPNWRPYSGLPMEIITRKEFLEQFPESDAEGSHQE